MVEERAEGRTVVEASPVGSSGSNGIVEKEAQEIEGDLRAALLALEAKDSRHERGDAAVLKHARYKEEFHGWLRVDRNKAIFVEEGTWMKVEVDARTVRQRESMLYMAMLSEHAKAKMEASAEARALHSST